MERLRKIISQKKEVSGQIQLVIKIFNSLCIIGLTFNLIYKSPTANTSTDAIDARATKCIAATSKFFFRSNQNNCCVFEK